MFAAPVSEEGTMKAQVKIAFKKTHGDTNWCPHMIQSTELLVGIAQGAIWSCSVVQFFFVGIIRFFRAVLLRKYS